MFTGLVRDKGIVTAVEWSESQHKTLRLTLRTRLAFRDLEKGASVACNGVCLTVCSEARQVTASECEFTVDLGPETLAVTRFAKVTTGQAVHLEPALRVGDALGGHNVTGHVDGLVRVVECCQTENGFKKLVLDIPSQWSAYMLPKGSVAVSGVSLTIAHIKPHDEKPKAVFIEIMLIPHTLLETCLGDLQPGDSVEMECDLMAKMVASVVTRMLNMRE